MGIRIVLVSLAYAWAAATSSQRGQTFNFDADRVGGAPAGFRFAAMRQDGPGSWLVRRDGLNGSLAHGLDPKAAGFALALATDGSERDIVATVRLRLSGGSKAGGLVWRYVDAANFYAAILDLTNRELFLWRVTGGNRVFLESKDDLELDNAAWHVLKVVHDDEDIAVSLGGIRVFEDRDRRGDRRPPTGRTGVMAAGNAEVWFDDLRIDPPRNR